MVVTSTAQAAGSAHRPGRPLARLLEIGGALRATGCPDIDRTDAFRAFFHLRSLRGGCLFLSVAVHLLDEYEYGKGDNNEIKRGVDEYAIAQHDGVGLGGLVLQRNHQIGEV